jgi:glutathione peroxidase
VGKENALGGEEALRRPPRPGLAKRLFVLASLILGSLVMGERAGLAMSAYDFSFVSIDGKPLPLAAYRGKAVLVVNTASFCGFTPQYEGLQTLWERYRNKGLIVLGVPSNDFGQQEPGSEKEIKEFCQVNFNVDFPLTRKEKVIGGDAHPFYRWAAAELGEGASPRWNFHKYLIGPSGAIAEVFPSKVEPLSAGLLRAIEANLPKP